MTARQPTASRSPRRRTRHAGLRGLLVLGCVAAATSVLAGGTGRFDFGDAPPIASAQDFAPWADMMRRRAAEPVSLEACLAAAPEAGDAHLVPGDAGACPPVLRGARLVVLRARGLDARARLELVNRFVNRRRYVDSLAATRWQTLVGFLRRGGDCEDYAVAKYFVLRALGVPAQDLRVVVGRTRRSGGHHALLAVRTPDGRALLLDTDDRIHPGERPGDYDYLYSVNEIGIWDHGVQPAAAAIAHLHAPELHAGPPLAPHEEEAHAH
jgi:predicted transglutaminase-like cysteine proteinase